MKKNKEEDRKVLLKPNWLVGLNTVGHFTT